MSKDAIVVATYTKRDGQVIGHCEEYDLNVTRPTYEEAKAEMRELIRASAKEKVPRSVMDYLKKATTDYVLGRRDNMPEKQGFEVVVRHLPDFAE